MKRANGAILVEVLVAMTVGAVILGIAATLLATVFRAAEATRSEFRWRGSLERLAEQFRDDVHAANRCAATITEKGRPQPSAWQFDLPGGQTVVYDVHRGGIDRTEQASGRVERRESFALPPEMTASIETSDQQARSRQLLALAISPQAKSGAKSVRWAARYEAVLARDQRYLRQPEANGRE